MELIFASSNQGKIREINELFPNPFKILGLNDIGFNQEIEETGNTLNENAFIKAKAVYDFCKKDCFADDSGLLVDALDGKPGVKSARFASEHHDDEANMKKLLHLLENKSNRNAHFKTCICLILNGETYFFEGMVEGQIAFQKSGNNGFGYDPIFIPNGYKTTFGEFSKEEKNKISHRKQAIAQLINFLNKTI